PAGPATAAPSRPPPDDRRPCPPILSSDAAPGGVAAPLPVPRGCFDFKAIIATVNRANVLYARAVRTLDTMELSQAWAGEALAEGAGRVRGVRETGRSAPPQLFPIPRGGGRLAGAPARGRTVEHWLYQERARLSGAVLLELDEWAANSYELSARS